MHSFLRRTAIGFTGFLAFTALAYWSSLPTAGPFALASGGNPPPETGAPGGAAALPPMGSALPEPAKPPADPPEAPNAEFRGLWVVATELTTPDKVREVVRRAKQHGFNALIVQVRMRGDALYRSDLVPRSELLDGQDASFDPLQLVLDEATPAGIEVHAWMNAFKTWSRPTPPRSPLHVRNSRPDWFLRGGDGKIHGLETKDAVGAYFEEGVFISPAHLEARRHLVAVYRELVERYDVAGIHFDYIRQPARTGPFAPGADYSPATVQRFRAETGREPAEHTPVWDQWRQDQVTALVRDVHREIKRLKPHVKISAAVMAVADIARGRSFTDYRSWLKEGILDFVVPMDYTRNLDDAAHYAAVALRAGGPGRVYVGLAAYLNQPAELLRQIEAVRALGAKGIVLFSYASLDDAYYAALTNGAFATPAARPSVPVAPTGWRPGPLPRPLEPEWIGRLPAEWRTRLGQVSSGDALELTRLFYVQSGSTTLLVDNHGLEILEVKVNDKPVPLPPGWPRRTGADRLDVSAFVDPRARPPAAGDHHTSKIAIRARGAAGAWADFSIDTRYE